MPVSLNPIVQNFLDKAGENRQNPLRALNRAQLPLGSRPDPNLGKSGVQPNLKLIYKGGGNSNVPYGKLGETAPTSAPKGAIQEYAKTLLDKYGWGDQWDAFNRLVTAESGWNPNAQNPTSTAYGIGQFLNSTWAGTGFQKSSDYRIQLQAMLQYIKNRPAYGSPAAAWNFWQNIAPVTPGWGGGHGY